MALVTQGGFPGGVPFLKKQSGRDLNKENLLLNKENLLLLKFGNTFFHYVYNNVIF